MVSEFIGWEKSKCMLMGLGAAAAASTASCRYRLASVLYLFRFVYIYVIAEWKDSETNNEDNDDDTFTRRKHGNRFHFSWNSIASTQTKKEDATKRMQCLNKFEFDLPARLLTCSHSMVFLYFNLSWCVAAVGKLLSFIAPKRTGHEAKERETRHTSHTLHLQHTIYKAHHTTALQW